MHDPVLLFCAPLRKLQWLVQNHRPSTIAYFLGLSVEAGIRGSGGFVALPHPLPVARIPQPDGARRDVIAAGIAQEVDGGLQIVDYDQYTEQLPMDIWRRLQRREAGRRSGAARSASANLREQLQLELAERPLAAVIEQTANETRTDAAGKEGFPRTPIPERPSGKKKKIPTGSKKKKATVEDYHAQLATWAPPGEDAAA